MTHVLLRNAYGEVLTEEDLARLGWDSDCAGRAHTIVRRLAMNFLIPFCKGVGLDIGSQACPITDTAIRIDHDPRFAHLQTVQGVAVSQFHNLDYIAASHVVEDFANPLEHLLGWLGTLKMGGHLCLIIPTCEVYPKPGQPGANPTHRYETYPETFIEWERALRAHMRIVQHDKCAALRAEIPGMFDTDCVYQRIA